MSNELKPILKNGQTDIRKGNILHFNPRRAPIVIPKDGWKGIRAGPVGKFTDPTQVSLTLPLFLSGVIPYRYTETVLTSPSPSLPRLRHSLRTLFVNAKK